MKISECTGAERCPPIEEVIRAGVVPRFVEFLDRHDLPQLQVWTMVDLLLVILPNYFYLFHGTFIYSIIYHHQVLIFTYSSV